MSEINPAQQQFIHWAKILIREAQSTGLQDIFEIAVKLNAFADELALPRRPFIHANENIRHESPERLERRSTTTVVDPIVGCSFSTWRATISERGGKNTKSISGGLPADEMCDAIIKCVQRWIDMIESLDTSNGKLNVEQSAAPPPPWQPMLDEIVSTWGQPVPPEMIEGLGYFLEKYNFQPLTNDQVDLATAQKRIANMLNFELDLVLKYYRGIDTVDRNALTERDVKVLQLALSDTFFRMHMGRNNIRDLLFTVLQAVAPLYAPAPLVSDECFADACYPTDDVASKNLLSELNAIRAHIQNYPSRFLGKPLTMLDVLNEFVSVAMLSLDHLYQSPYPASEKGVAAQVHAAYARYRAKFSDDKAGPLPPTDELMNTRTGVHHLEALRRRLTELSQSGQQTPAIETAMSPASELLRLLAKVPAAAQAHFEAGFKIVGSRTAVVFAGGAATPDPVRTRMMVSAREKAETERQDGDRVWLDFGDQIKTAANNFLDLVANAKIDQTGNPIDELICRWNSLSRSEANDLSIKSIAFVRQGERKINSAAATTDALTHSTKTTDTKKWHTVGEAATIANVDAYVISRAVDSGDLEGTGRGTDRRVAPESLTRFILDQHKRKEERDRESKNASEPVAAKKIAAASKKVVRKASFYCDGCGETFSSDSATPKCPKGCIGARIDPH